MILIKFGVYDCVKRFGKKREQNFQQPQNSDPIHPLVPVQEVRIPDISADDEREPLIAIVARQSQ